MVKINALIRPCIVARANEIEFNTVKTVNVNLPERAAEIEA